MIIGNGFTGMKDRFVKDNYEGDDCQVWKILRNYYTNFWSTFLQTGRLTENFSVTTAT